MVVGRGDTWSWPSPRPVGMSEPGGPARSRPRSRRCQRLPHPSLTRSFSAPGVGALLPLDRGWRSMVRRGTVRTARRLHLATGHRPQHDNVLLECDGDFGLTTTRGWMDHETMLKKAAPTHSASTTTLQWRGDIYRTAKRSFLPVHTRRPAHASGRYSPPAPWCATEEIHVPFLYAGPYLQTTSRPPLRRPSKQPRSYLKFFFPRLARCQVVPRDVSRQPLARLPLPE